MDYFKHKLNKKISFKSLGIICLSLLCIDSVSAQNTQQKVVDLPEVKQETKLVHPATEKQQIIVDSIAAVVNNDVITMQELNERIFLIQNQLKKQNITLPPEDELQKQVLEHMIVESAQLQMAKEIGLRVSDAQLDKTIEMMAANGNMSVEQFKAQTANNGIPFEKLRENIRKEITMQRLRDREVASKVQVNEAEVDHLVGQSQKQSPVSQEYKLGHILVRIPENASPEQISEKRERAERVLKLLRAGGDFQQNAASYSDADEGLSGGDIGWRTADHLPAIFVEALSKINTGEITDIIKSANGFHILKILDKRTTSSNEGNQKNATKNVVQQIHARHILIKVSKLVTADDAKRKLIDIKQRILNKSDSFEQLAKTFSNDSSASKGGDLGWIYPGDTVPEFEKALLALQPGELSEPIETQFGFHLIEVLEKKMDDASVERKRVAAKQALRSRKIAEQSEEWLRQLRDKAYVEYRLYKTR